MEEVWCTENTYGLTDTQIQGFIFFFVIGHGNHRQSCTLLLLLLFCGVVFCLVIENPNKHQSGKKKNCLIESDCILVQRLIQSDWFLQERQKNTLAGTIFCAENENSSSEAAWSCLWLECTQPQLKWDVTSHSGECSKNSTQKKTFFLVTLQGWHIDKEVFQHVINLLILAH